MKEDFGNKKNNLGINDKQRKTTQKMVRSYQGGYWTSRSKPKIRTDGERM